MNTNENLHAGHRERLRDMIERTGIYQLSDLHFLENLLTFVIPRVDTNPIAHRLIEEFKTIDNIFEASIQALEKIEGVGPKTARFIQYMSSVCYMNNKAKAMKKSYIGTTSAMINYIQGVMPPSDNEQFIVLIAGKNFEVKTYKVFKGVSHSFITVDANELSDYLIKHKASFCLLAHTHPEHTALPSASDKDAMGKIGKLLDSLQITLLDNLILGKKDFYSFRFDRIKRYSELNYDYKAEKFINEGEGNQ